MTARKRRARRALGLLRMLGALCTLLLLTAACAPEKQEAAPNLSLLPTPAQKQSDGGAAVVQIPAFPPATDTPAPSPEQEEEAPDEPEAEGEPTPEPTPAPEPSETRFSSTTGLPRTGRNPYRPVLIAVRNDANAQPQTALTNADVVYEFAVETMTTGFLAVYSDSYPETVGPVDSARCYTVTLQKEWNALFAFNGYPSAEVAGYPRIKQSDIHIDVDATERPALFEEGESGLYVSAERLRTERYLSRTVSEQARFSFLADVAYPEGEEFSRVGIPFMSNDTGKVEFCYDGGTNRLVRYENGVLCMNRTVNAEAKGYTLTELETQNLIVQYCDYSFCESGYYRLLNLVGKGRCDYFVNGRHVEGTWERGSETQYTRYRLSDGSVLLLEPGSTWIVLQSAEKQIYIGF